MLRSEVAAARVCLVPCGADRRLFVQWAPIPQARLGIAGRIARVNGGPITYELRTFMSDMSEGKREVASLSNRSGEESDARGAWRERQERIGCWMNALPSIVWQADTTGARVDCNDAWVAYTGQPRDEGMGYGWLEAVHPVDRERLRDGLTTSLPDEAAFQIEYRLRRASDGSYRWHLCRGNPIRDPEGRVVAWVGTTTDIEEHKRAEGLVRESEARGRAILASLTEGVMFYDGSGAAVSANDAALQLLGLSMEELTGRVAVPPVWGLLRTDGTPLPPEECPLNVALRTGCPQRDKEVGVRRPDGSLLWICTNAQPMRVDEGKTAGVVVSFFDITQRKRVEETLREVDRRKDEFLAVLSHELRGPLAPIRMSLHVLNHSEADGQQAHQAKEIIARQVTYLVKLVDDLLEVTRIGRGKILIQQKRLDLVNLISRISDDHRALMQAQQLQFVVDLPGQQVWVDGDGTRLAQVVGNLLHNAAKFTPGGGRVTLSVVPLDKVAEVRVRDTGRGIEPNLLERVFEPFVQAKQTLARSEGGLGLGLALVKGLTELHGGTVRVASGGKNEGAEFIVRLPTQPAPAVHHVVTQPASANRSRRVLVVEDNEDAASSLAQVIEMFGHEVVVALDGPTAIARAKSNPPDAVLCDIGLPGMSGFDLARLFRQEPALSR